MCLYRIPAVDPKPYQLRTVHIRLSGVQLDYPPGTKWVSFYSRNHLGYRGSSENFYVKEDGGYFGVTLENKQPKRLCRYHTWF